MLSSTIFTDEIPTQLIKVAYQIRQWDTEKMEN